MTGADWFMVALIAVSAGSVTLLFAGVGSERRR